MTTMTERDAYRAAAQAYAAAILGLPIAYVSVNGIVLGYAANDSRSTWSDKRSEVALGLAGIAAVERFRFGTAVDGSVTFPGHEMTEQQCEDWHMVQSLADEIDFRGERRVLYDGWNLAAELIGNDDVWGAIEWIAGIVEDVRLDGVAIMHMIDGLDHDRNSLDLRKQRGHASHGGSGTPSSV
jgi:hypothetical protein